jgi:hypothetical protein
MPRRRRFVVVEVRISYMIGKMTALDRSTMTESHFRHIAASLRRTLPARSWHPVRAIATAIVTPISFSVKTGHLRSSLSQSSVLKDGTPIPWYTYPAIHFLKQRSFDNKDVLEFGGGQSTLWWSSRARSVLTIEENAIWFARLRQQVGGNVSVRHIPVDLENRQISTVKQVIDANPIRKFDVIVVDGHLRKEVTALAFDYLAPKGAIILDDAEGYGFYEETRVRNCRRIDFFGFAPGVSLGHCTSIVYVEDCFLLNPEIPIGREFY